jgi:hypothetical protein
MHENRVHQHKIEHRELAAYQLLLPLLDLLYKKARKSSVSSSSRLVLSASTAVGLVHFHSKLLGEEYTLQRMHASLCSNYRTHTLVRKHAKKQAHAYIASQQSP